MGSNVDLESHKFLYGGVMVAITDTKLIAQHGNCPIYVIVQLRLNLEVPVKMESNWTIVKILRLFAKSYLKCRHHFNGNRTKEFFCLTN